DKIVQKAIEAGAVPARGTAPLNMIPARIENQIKPSLHIDVCRSEIRQGEYGNIVWREVEINWPEFVQYAEANLIPPWASVSLGREPARPKTRGRKTIPESHKSEILAKFDEMKIFPKRGGLTAAARELSKTFPKYKLDSIRKIIQRRYRERCAEPHSD